VGLAAGSGAWTARRRAAAKEAPFSEQSHPLSEQQAGDWKRNEVIRQARQAALEVLKPSKKDLQHGLELHAHSVVFEAHGFVPRAAVHGDAIRRAVEQDASAEEVKDLREWMTMTRYATDPLARAEFLQAWAASGVTCIFQNAGQEGQDPLRLIKRLAHFTCGTDMMRDLLFKAVTPDDIEAAEQQQRRCLYFSANGVPLRQRWVSVEDALRYVRIFFELGIRMMHLTYRRRNMSGDGCGERSDGGPSASGKAAVAEMNRVGVIVDVAHSGWENQPGYRQCFGETDRGRRIKCCGAGLRCHEREGSCSWYGLHQPSLCSSHWPPA